MSLHQRKVYVAFFGSDVGHLASDMKIYDLTVNHLRHLNKRAMMALNRSPKFKGVFVQIVCSVWVSMGFNQYSLGNL